VYYKGSISNNLALGTNFRLNTFIENAITRFNALPSSLTDTYINTITPTYTSGPLLSTIAFVSTGASPSTINLSLNWTTANAVSISALSTALTTTSAIGNYGHYLTGTSPYAAITVADGTGGIVAHNAKQNINVDLNYRLPSTGNSNSPTTIVVQLLIAGTVVKSIYSDHTPNDVTRYHIGFNYVSASVNSGQTVAVNVSLLNVSGTAVSGIIDVVGGGLSVTELGS
jgi:hypothetical protein